MSKEERRSRKRVEWEEMKKGLKKVADYVFIDTTLYRYARIHLRIEK